MVTEEQLIHDAIAADLSYTGRLAASLVREQAIAGIAQLCMSSYMALFIHESYEKLKKLDAGAARQMTLSPDAAAGITRSRHTLKLFEDTARGLEGQLDYFKTEVIAVHRAQFIQGIRLPFLRFLGKDLGIYRYEGVPVTTSHVAAFALGMKPQAFFGKSAGQNFQQLGYECGVYLASWGVEPDSDATAFPSYMQADQLESADVRAETEYCRLFNGAGTPEINAVLSVFQGLLNTADKLLPLDTAADSRQTGLKLRFLSVYSILRSLAILQRERASQLCPESIKAITAMTSHPTATFILDGSRRRFRNLLMHYGPYNGIDPTRLSLGQPLYGLVEYYFGMDFDAFDQLLTGLVSELATEINAWAGI